MSSYGLGRPSGNYYNPSRSSYGMSSNYGSYGGYSKPSYTPSSSKYGSSSYIVPPREKSMDRGSTGGYTSDYGKSGYTSDYGKSGYASDRSRVGYTSDYNAKPNSTYSSYSKPSYGYGRNTSRQNSITGSDRLSRQNSITSNDNLSRQNSITGLQSLSRQNSITGAKTLSRQNSVTGRDNFYRRDSYGGLNNYQNSNYGRYSRSQSREEVSNNLNGLVTSNSKSKVNCKAPADFTTDESESEEEEEEESEDDSELEDDEILLVTRPTSPSKESSNGTTSNKVAVMKKEKIKVNPNRQRNTTETSCQVVPEDIPVKRERFISSRPTSLYLNKYYPSSSRFSSTPSTRIYGTNSAETTPKTPENTSKIPLMKQQLSVDEPASAGGFSRDASPNARSQGDEPNKDFRKSVLNMNVDDSLKDEYGRRQEEMRRHRRRHGGVNSLSTEQQSSSATPTSSEDENHLHEPDQEVRKRKVLKKSPSRSGILSKCGSRSKVESIVKKSPSHARVQRRFREEGSEAKQTSSTSSSSTASSSEDENSRTRTRQRWKGTRSSREDTEETNDQLSTKEDAPVLVIHPPAENQETEQKDEDELLQKLMKVPSSESSDLTSPGEVVHLTFPCPKTPPPLERVDSGRNVAVSVNVADFLKPRAGLKTKSSSSGSEETSSSEEEDERDLLTPVVPINDPEGTIKSPEPLQTKKESESSSSDEEDEEEEEEEEEEDENKVTEKLSGNVQRSATVIQVKETEKDDESSEEESSEESSEEESEDENTKLKRCPTQVIKPPIQETKKIEPESESEEESEEESSSDEKAKINDSDRKSSSDVQPSKDEVPQLNGESYWPKSPKKDSLPTPDNLTLFIGQCKDIDDMLGSPKSTSPNSASIFNSSPTKSPTKQQPFKFQASITPAVKKESSSSSSEEEDNDSSDIEEVEASVVKFHESKPQKPELGAYTEEIDSSAVRIRENKPLTSELAGEEIDSSSVKIRQPTVMQGHISKVPIQKAEECEIVKRGSLTNGTYVDNNRRRSSSSNQLISKANALIEKLKTTENRDLRRTLFSLKQVFQDEKDLVGAFIESGGLSLLVKVGNESDHSYQNYILRALGQVMLYVDGMNGIIQHADTLKWLYNLAASKYRMVSKMAVKLLLMFVEYGSGNALLLKDIVTAIDRQKGNCLWSNIMQHLKEKENLDMELLTYCMTLVNKVADSFNDQDDYFDFVDSFEEQGMEKIVQFHLCRAGTDKELLKQLQIYEAVLKHEDGEDDGKPFAGKFVQRTKKTNLSDRRPNQERRKSRRHSTPIMPTFMSPKSPPPASPTVKTSAPPWARRNSREGTKPVETTSATKDSDLDIDDDTGITPALRRRRDARNRTLTGQSDPNYPTPQQTLPSPEIKEKPAFHSDRATVPSLVSKQRSLFENQKEEEPPKESLARRPSRGETSLVKQQIQAEVKPVPPPSPSKLPFVRQNSGAASIPTVPTTPPTNIPKPFYGQQNRSPVPYSAPVEAPKFPTNSWNNNQKVITPPEEKPQPKFQLKKDNSHKDLQNKYLTQEKPALPEANRSRFGTTPGVVNRAKEGLAGYGTTTRNEPRSPQGLDLRRSASGVKELHWDQLLQTMRRPLRINDLDFTDLGDDDDVSILMRPVNAAPFPGAPPPPPMPGGGPPPPPPFGMGGPPPPPPPPGLGGPPPPPPMMGGPPPPPPAVMGVNRGMPTPPPWLRKNAPTGSQSPVEQNQLNFNKRVKTVKLFWKEVKEEPMLMERSGKKRTIWDELKPVPLDTQRLENLFENKSKDIMSKKAQDGNKKTELIVLDTKRSNAINIGMTKLPPKGAIKAAILKMDTTIMNREGIEKILTTMMPTEEEKKKIVEAQLENTDIPLGSAEQFLLTLASISELEARLRLWAFRLDYEAMEKEVAEPLMDLKLTIVEIESSKTLRAVLGTLLSIGNFLNNTNAKGFSLDYLSKVPEVKDTVHKHSLLHHICTIVMEKFPDSTNLYSEFGATTRVSKVDFDELSKNLVKMETECKASWEHLKAVTKHDGIPINKSRLSDFLSDCAERIITLGIIHRRLVNRFHKLLVYLGFPSHAIREAKVHTVCKVISEFALEYRTCRERVQQQIEKAAALKERNKTKGKMITQTEKFRPQTKEQKEDLQLRQILGESDAEEAKMTQWGSMINLRGRPKPGTPGGTLSRPNSVMMLDRGYSTPYESTTDIDDEILDSLLKTATAQPNRTEPRNRKKARYADRKSLRRTLKGGLDIGDALGT